MKISVARQRGAALMVTLVLLVVSLLLGVTSFQNARFEESMAGNQRAGSLALMAAEHGASDFWYKVNGATDMKDPGDPSESDTVDSYTLKILQALKDWAEDGGFVLGDCVVIDSSNSNTCYRVRVEPPSGEIIPVVIDGIVHSGGDLDGDGVPDEIISQRRIGMDWGVVLGETLSPFNYAGYLFQYDGITSQAEVEGEEDVDGYVNPAISVSSREDAEKITRDILGNNSSKFDQHAVFVPDNPDDYREDGSYGPFVEGVYHDKSVVDMTKSPPVYNGNYGDCDNQSSDLCNYKGGVASKLGTPILSNTDAFDDFVGKLVNQPEVIWGDAAAVQSEAVDPDNQSEEGKVFFVTDQEGGEYYRPVYDEEMIREKEKNNAPDDERMERQLFDLGTFDHKGILVVDGDVEFSGNPEFEGLIVVLGDYTIDGSGGEPFTGAIISAPYSLHYYDVDGNLVNPERNDSGLLVDGSGNVIAPEGSKVVFHDNGTSNDVTDDFPVVVDADGNLLYQKDADGNVILGDDGDPLLLEPYFHGAVEARREFDASGVKINGGGSQEYNYDYSVIEEAFGLLSDETLLSYLVGQARPDGSYEYGLSTWREVVAMHD